jgi:hypothetical protein
LVAVDSYMDTRFGLPVFTGLRIHWTVGVATFVICLLFAEWMWRVVRWFLSFGAKL